MPLATLMHVFTNVHAINEITPAASGDRRAIRLDEAQRLLVVDGVTVRMSEQQVVMMRLMLDERGHPVSLRQIAGALRLSVRPVDQHFAEDMYANSVLLRISRLRRVLADVGVHDLIVTAPNSGYMIP